MNKNDRKRLAAIRLRAFELRKRVHEDRLALKELGTKRGLTPDNSNLARGILDMINHNQTAAETAHAIVQFMEVSFPGTVELLMPAPYERDAPSQRLVRRR